MNSLEFILRFSLCVLFSLFIGYERDNRNQFGLKLYMLVCTGTFLFVTVADSGIGDGTTRIAAQIVSGISFLGTGAIIINNNELKGLNVAATMWCVTAIGMLIGFGFVFEAILGTFVVIFINRYVNSRKMKYVGTRNNSRQYLLYICYYDNVDIDSKINFIKDYIDYKKVKRSIIFKYNVCNILVKEIDWTKLNIFVNRLDNDRDIKSISFDIYD